MSSKSNILFNGANQLVTLLAPLLLVPFLSRTIGTEGLGLFSFCQSIVQVLVVLGTFGLDVLGQRTIGSIRETAPASRFFLTAMLLKFIGSIFSTLGIVVVAFTVKQEYSMAFLCFIPTVLLNFLDITWYFIGRDNFKSIALRSVILKVLGVVLTFCLVRGPEDVHLYIGITVVTAVLGNLTLWWNLFKKREIQASTMSAIPYWSILKSAASLYYIQVVTVFAAASVRLIIEQYLSVDALGIFDTMIRLVFIPVSLICSMPATFVAQISTESANYNSKRVKDLVESMVGFVTLLGFPVAFGIAILSADLAVLFLGKASEAGAQVLVLCSSIIVVNSLSYVVGTQYQIYTGQDGRFGTTLTLGVVVGFVLNMVTIPYFGLQGASSVATLMEILVLSIHAYRTRKTLHLLGMLVRISWKHLVASIAMALLVWALAGSIHLDVLLEVALLALVGALSYGLVLIFLKDGMVRKIVT